LADGGVEIVESKDSAGQKCFKNPFPIFLSKIKLPKDWSNLPRKYWLLTLTSVHTLLKLFRTSETYLFIDFTYYIYL